MGRSGMQCSVGKGEEMGKAHVSGEVARSVGIVLKRECKLQTTYSVFLLGVLALVHVVP
jgi:hypothetical protein